MDTEATTTFPPHPLRGVRALFVRQAGCPSDFADVTVDFEPWEEGVSFEIAATADVKGYSPEELAELHAAVEAGVREELAELSGRTTVAVAVVLRSVRIHEVDSHPRAFRMAGRVAVRNALAKVDGPPSVADRFRGGGAASALKERGPGAGQGVAP